MSNRTSSSFIARFTVGDYCHEQTIAMIKQNVSDSNRLERQREELTGKPAKLKRVCLKPRSPREKFLNPDTGNYIGFTWSGDVIGGMANAGAVDLYIYDRYTW